MAGLSGRTPLWANARTVIAVSQTGDLQGWSRAVPDSSSSNTKSCNCRWQY